MPAPDFAVPVERPHVTVNFAVTWDSRISTRNHTPSDFSSRADKHRLLEIRAQGDAVLASARTVAADRMTMGLPDDSLRNARLARGQTEYPLRILLTNSGAIDPNVPVFTKGVAPVHIFSTECMPSEVRDSLATKATLHLDSGSTVDLARMMRTLRQKLAVERLVCEGGGEVFRSLLALDLVDDIHLTFCPRVFGGAASPTLTGIAASFLPCSIKCEPHEMEVHAEECFLLYRVLRARI
jgi:riboflavin-specific deaminase-like protein